MLDGPPSSRGQAAGDRQLDHGPTEVPALTIVVRHGPVSAGWHSAGGFRAKTDPTGSDLKTDPGVDHTGL